MVYFRHIFKAPLRLLFQRVQQTGADAERISDIDQLPW